MLLQLRHRALYAAFDRYPTAKGAAVHISRMARTLFDAMNGGLLFVLGDALLPGYQKEDTVEILRVNHDEPNFLRRAISFGTSLSDVLDEQRQSLELCHFRDPWSGVPILERAERRYRTVFEINGLPSIELPYAYPNLGPETLAKIRATEEFCWREADRIITPSEVMKQNLAARGVPVGKIDVIPNGADVLEPTPRPLKAPPRYLIYFGALQPWQGVDVLLRAFALLRDLDDLWLVICASGHRRQSKPYRKFAEKLEVAERTLWTFDLREEQLAPWRANAELSIAPLTECSRNVEQGCAPLKVLESLAAGVPVVASDLPSVREIVRDGIEGRLVRPDRPAELARAIRIMLEYPSALAEMKQNARLRIQNSFTWQKSLSQLAGLYRSLGPAAEVIT